MRLVRLLLVGVAPLFFSSCVILFNHPVNRFDSPEALGERWKAHFDAGLGGSNSVILTPNTDTTPVSSVSPSFERDDALTRLQFGLGILERLDFDIKGSLSSKEPVIVQAKYQLLGEPRAHAADGNFALAVTAGLGLMRGSGSGESTSTSPTRYDLHGSGVDAALIAGYRFNSAVSIYGGGFFTAFGYSGSQTLSTGTVSPFDGSSQQLGGNLGVDFGFERVRFKLEGAEGSVSAGGRSAQEPYLGLLGSFFL